MRTINKFYNSMSALRHVIVVIGLLCFISSCEKDMEGKIFQVSDELMIDEIMEQKDELSSFLTVVEIAEMRGVIHAYGHNYNPTKTSQFTLFAPNNDGVNSYLTTINRTLSDLTKEEAEDIVKYHLIIDTIPSADFIDGRLEYRNFKNSYLTTKTVNDEVTGVTYLVNRTARILDKDLRGANGFLHVLDKVLTPPDKSITDVIRELSPLEYSLMKEVFELSGFAETLEHPLMMQIPKTFFIQDNQSFLDLEINNVDELLVRLRANTPDVTNDEQLLFNYIAYHCARSEVYVSDLLMLSSLFTAADNQSISLKRNVDQVLLNEFEINGVLEPGVPVDRTSDYTDLACSDGVIHKINGNIEIVKRAAYRVYFDIAEQPEIMALKGFRKDGTSVTFNNGELSRVSWGGKNPGGLQYNALGYRKTIDKNSNFVYGDNLKFRICTATIGWLEFKTPVLAEGKYKVWVGLRYANTDNGVKPADIRTVFKQNGEDDQILGVTEFRYGSVPSSYQMTEMDEAFHIKLEQDGQRIYCMSMKKNPDTANACFLVGIVDVTSQGEHTIRFEAVTAARFDSWWDVIHFIPMEEDQIWPKQDVRGNMIYQDTEDCAIWPSTCAVDPDPEEGEETE